MPRSRGLIIGLVVAAVALLGAIIFFATSGDDGSSEPSATTTKRTTVASTTSGASTTSVAPTTSSAPTTSVGPGTEGEVILTALDSAPSDPFTASVALTPAAPITVALPPLDLPVAPDPDGGQTSLLGVNGNQAGLYGGTKGTKDCDARQLVDFLEQDSQKAAAWAGVQGIAVADLGDFGETLTPVILTRDTRITDHGFQDGQAVPRQAILQAGTAVLVDTFGVPRVKCSSGSPLLPPVPTTQAPTYVGSWPNFDPAAVVVVTPATELSAVTLVDVTTGVPFQRPVSGFGLDEDVSTEVLCDLFPDDPACAAPPPDEAPVLFDNHNRGGVQNDPTGFPTLEFVEPTVVTYIQTYHWNDGQGSPAGEIWIQSLIDGTVFGPWQSEGTDGQGGAASVYWNVSPMVEVPPGLYSVLDADPATWSWNDESLGVGMAIVRGYPSGSGPTPSPPPGTGPSATTLPQDPGLAAITILDAELKACGYNIDEYTDNGFADPEGYSVIASTPQGPAEFIVVSASDIRVNDQTAADIAVECGFYQP